MSNSYYALPLPASEDAEVATLGSMLIDKMCLETGIDYLQQEDFYNPKNADIFYAMSEVYKENKPVDLVTITEKLQQMKKIDAVGGVTYLSSMAESVPTTANMSHYVGIIKEKSGLRKLISIGRTMQELGYKGENADEAIDEAESMVFGLATSASGKQSMTKTKDFVYDYFKMLEERSKAGGGLTGVSTGFTDLNRMTAGLQGSDLIIVAGRPSMGKTAFSLNIAENVASDNGKVAIFSLEMSKEQLLERMVCSQAKVSGENLRRGSLSEDEWKAVKESLGNIKNWDLEIDDNPSITVAEMRSKLRKSHAEKTIDLVVIDYLGLINMSSGKNVNKTDAVGEVTKALKQLARELDCPIILLSQLNRGIEQREDKRPMMSDIRDSGSVEQDADVIMFLYRDEYYDVDSPAKGIAEVIIAKQRKGAVGTVQLAFIKNFTKFVNLERKVGRSA
ncbi:replicative DNA helicase [Priestia endophytica]|uniref:replicative DNA helicase n=1 Tax=Priestia endophytica TaxID=135735 RepID=UPI003D2A24FC